MLVLSRKQGETVRIGEEICLTIVDVSGGVVKVGIDAPQRIPVHRGEVYERIQRENNASVHEK